MMLKSMLGGLAIALGLAAGSAHSQILQNLENAITGDKPSQADISAARQEVQVLPRARCRHSMRSSRVRAATSSGRPATPRSAHSG